jgi:hypothetical protein
MPELALHFTPPSDPPPAVLPPIIRPQDFEDDPTFRESFLLCVPDPRANLTLRVFGRLLHELVLGTWGDWSLHPEGIFRASLRATVADLRHVQGSLAESTGPDTVAEPHEAHLAMIGAHVARDLGALADRLEADLNSRLDGPAS